MNPLDCWVKKIHLFDATTTLSPYDGWFISDAEYAKYVRVNKPKLIPPPKPVQPRKQQQQQQRPKQQQQPVEMKERMCKNILATGRCRFRPCRFAHHAGELAPPVCKYRHCRYTETCSYIHYKESKDQYIERLRKAHNG